MRREHDAAVNAQKNAEDIFVAMQYQTTKYRKMEQWRVV
jgi:hypothetical protein